MSEKGLIAFWRLTALFTVMIVVSIFCGFAIGANYYEDMIKKGQAIYIKDVEYRAKEVKSE